MSEIKQPMYNNNTSSRGRVDADLLGNISSYDVLHNLNEGERKDNRKKKEKAVRKNSVHLELQSPLVIAQCISLLPIYGTSDPDFKNLRFQWKSLKMVYSVAVLVFNFILSVLAINRYVRDRGVTYTSLGDIMFYGGSLFTSIFFLKLVKDWKDLVSQWAALQSDMNNFESLAVQKEIKIVTICLVFSSVFEHILSNTQFMLMANENTDRVRMFLDNGNVSSVVGYIPWLAAIVYLLHFLFTLIWNYPDIFLTAISLSLANMFKQFNKDLKLTYKMISKESSLSYWRKKREMYNRLSILSKMVENKVSHLVLLSFAINVYFICIQLLNSIKPLNSLLQVAYFCSSFGHILLRTCTVCFAASSIYENSKESLKILFSVPSEQYNCEVQRLITQMSLETLALTGCRFFTVTRKLMLTIAGTIVTYEVVLLQFSGLATGDSTPATEQLPQLTSQ